MKIMWITAQKLSKIKEAIDSNLNSSGGWVVQMLNELKQNKNISEIRVVSVAKQKKPTKFKDGLITYVELPSKNGVFKFDKELSYYLNEQINNFNPDIIDVQGVEFFLLNSVLETKTNTPLVATLQGLTSEIYKQYFAGIPLKYLINKRTLRDNIFLDGILERKYKYKKRGKNEVALLRKLKYVIGRTEWDKTHALNKNPKLKYFKCNRNIRDVFYKTKWDFNKIERYTILTTQAHYPLKGLHQLLESLSYIIKDYPETTLYIAGKNMLDKTTLFKKLIFSGYQKYIKYLIDKFGLNKNIVFTGYLNDKELADMMSKTHVFVLPSVLENSSNALAEAQLVGTPSIATYTGGNIDYIKNNKSGLLYNFYEPVTLKNMVIKLFEDKDLCCFLSSNSRRIASERHNKKINSTELINIYNEIISTC